MKVRQGRPYDAWLGLFRIYAGLFWLTHGIPKFLNPQMFMPPGGYMAQMVARATAGTTGSYHDFLVQTVGPHLVLFAELVRFGEVLTGISLLLGLFSRFGGLVGCVLAVNYMLAAGELRSLTVIGTLDGAAFAISFLALVLPLGRIAGLDAVLGRRPRREPVVVPEFVDEPPGAPLP